ncbi:hypothetical protein D3C72_2369170 [compost metagenome]
MPPVAALVRGEPAVAGERLELGSVAPVFPQGLEQWPALVPAVRVELQGDARCGVEQRAGGLTAARLYVLQRAGLR